MTIKEELLKGCIEHVQQRIDLARRAIDSLQRDANEETKSSAGDKYETGRAMVQQEIEKHLQQLSEAQRQMQILSEIKPDAPHLSARVGSVVRTDNGNYFLSVPAGKLIAGQNLFYA